MIYSSVCIVWMLFADSPTLAGMFFFPFFLLHSFSAVYCFESSQIFGYCILTFYLLYITRLLLHWNCFPLSWINFVHVICFVEMKAGYVEIMFCKLFFVNNLLICKNKKRESYFIINQCYVPTSFFGFLVFHTKMLKIEA